MTAPDTAPPERFPPEPFTSTYRLAMAICVPIVRTWGRLEVEGLEVLPRGGPCLVIANHDSQTDPIAIGCAARKRRQIRALAKSTLWEKPGLGRVLDGMGQIPIVRAAGDAGALAKAVEALRGGACIGVFPEGTISVGRTLRARSGVGRLALDVPEARLVCATVTGTPDIARFPTRPKIRVRFFEPASGQTRPDESAAEISERLLAELRALAPPVDAGRDPAKTLVAYEKKAADQQALRDRRAAEADREKADAP